MNQSQLLAKKYNLPEIRLILTVQSAHDSLVQHPLTPLNRDISALMVLARLRQVSIEFTGERVAVGSYRRYYSDFPNDNDALCECLCHALLAE